MIAFAIVAHWLACIWYVIGLSEIADKSTVGWLYALGEAINKPYYNFTQESGPDEGSAYVTALYFTLTSMTTVGFGNVAANTNSEKIFAVITMLIGGLLSIRNNPLHLCIHKLSLVLELRLAYVSWEYQETITNRVQLSYFRGVSTYRAIYRRSWFACYL